jgi:hypothetical protein
MTPDQAIAAFCALSPAGQLLVLADYAFNLTVIARGTYVPQTEDIADPQRLRLLNEVQHRVTGHMRHLLAGDVKRYPDDVIVRIIIAEHDAELLSGFAAAIGNCRDVG